MSEVRAAHEAIESRQGTGLDSTQIHLAEIALNIAPGAHAVVPVDGAGWHTSTAIVTPANITLLKLPADCLELNA